MTEHVRFYIVGAVIRLSDDEFEELVEQAVEALPAEFESYLRDLVIDVQDMPDRKTVRELGLRDPRSLLGLYHGIPLTSRSVEQSGRLPDRITIYKANIEAHCDSRDEVVEQVGRTVLHEIGHHFGVGERDLRKKGY